MKRIMQADDGRKLGIVGGAILPHAPQFLSLPKTEDHAQVARCRAAMQTVGDGLRGLKPDLVIVIANAHGEHFAVDCVPPFAIYGGKHANGMGKHAGPWPLEGEAGMELLEHMLDAGFDPAYTLNAEVGTSFTIPLEFCGYDRDLPFLAIFVNAYCPPLPKPERCFQFGKELARSVELMGRRAVILASGGLSHFPATPMYPTPDIETDKIIHERMCDGNLNYFLSFDEKRLDATGNGECRSALILAGALGPERKPDVTAFEPSWHHIYGIYGWTRPYQPDTYQPYYPATPTRHADLARALYALITNKDACRQFVDDPRAFADRYDLANDERSSLLNLNEDFLRENFSINPMFTRWAKAAISDCHQAKA